MNSGKCLCRTVKFTATPKSHDVGVCHCNTCRHQVAGPYFALDCGDTLKFEDDSKVAVYDSSHYAERVFCPKCGTMLVWRMKDRSMNIVNVDAFDALENLTLDHEVYIDKKPDYYSFAQKTKQMTEADIQKMFAAGGEQ